MSNMRARSTAAQRVDMVSTAREGEPAVWQPPRPLAKVDGWPVHVANQCEVLTEIVRAARSGAGFTVFTLNLDHLVKLRQSAAFREAYLNASIVTADGAPVAALTRRQTPRLARVTGADLVLPLAEAAADNGLPVFLFGTSPQVLADAGQRLERHCDGRLDICGSLAPPPGFDPMSAAADVAIAQIRASGARLCFVALGAPKQEIFAARAVAAGVKTGFICIGAGLDFLAGEQIRAPRIFQRTGTEWLWRLMSNPIRLGGRYARCAMLLTRIAIIEPAWRQTRLGRARG